MTTATFILDERTVHQIIIDYVAERHGFDKSRFRFVIERDQDLPTITRVEVTELDR
jgi:hypothetical protein